MDEAGPNSHEVALQRRAPGAMPIYYQAIEMLALFALAAIGAGQVFGFDALLQPLWASALRRHEPAPARLAAAR